MFPLMTRVIHSFLFSFCWMYSENDNIPTHLYLRISNLQSCDFLKWIFMLSRNEKKQLLLLYYRPKQRIIRRVALLYSFLTLKFIHSACPSLFLSKELKDYCFLVTYFSYWRIKNNLYLVCYLNTIIISFIKFAL